MKKYQKGFTLIEVMVVVLVLSLLSIVAIPRIIVDYKNKTFEVALKECPIDFNLCEKPLIE